MNRFSFSDFNFAVTVRQKMLNGIVISYCVEKAER